MNTLEQEIRLALIESAHERYGSITPCNCQALIDCFTKVDNRLYFWFNTPDCSTHTLHVDLEDSLGA